MKALNRRIDRRTMLRGAGVVVALPWLESLPVWGAELATSSTPTIYPKRFAALTILLALLPSRETPHSTRSCSSGTHTP